MAKYPGTGGVDIPRAKQPSESEATPRNELVLKVVREAEEQRVSDNARVNLRLVRVETAVDKFEALASRMDAHLTAAELREQAAAKRAKRVKWIVTAVALPVIVAVVGSGAAAWAQLTFQARSQAGVVSTQTVQHAQPSTEDTYRQGYRDGAQIEGAKIRDTLLAQIPMVPQTVVASRPKQR